MVSETRIVRISLILMFLLLTAILINNYTKESNGIVCKGNAICINGTIERVIDGDTLVIANKTIRLALVSTPENYEDFGKNALNFTVTLCPIGTTALVDEDDEQTKGSYGRIVAVVYCNRENLNEALLNADLGSISTIYCDKSEFKNEKWAIRYGC